MGMTTPQQAATNWARGMANSGEKFKAGVNAVTESPMEKAANSADRMLAGVQRAVSEGKWQAGLRRTNLQDWKSAMIDKGANRISTGATQAQPKFAAFMAQFLPYLANGVASLPARGDINQNLERARQMALHNHAFRRNS